jgi:hypothetical protein
MKNAVGSHKIYTAPHHKTAFFKNILLLPSVCLAKETLPIAAIPPA